MARVPGAESIYEAADLFRKRCLINHESFLWPGHYDWTIDNLEALWDAFIGHPDTGNRTFLDKWEDQLAQQTEDIHRIATDIISFYYLFPTNITTTSKLMDVGTVSSWKLKDKPHEYPILQKAYAKGIGSAGMWYSTGRPWMVAYYIAFANEVLSRNAQINDPLETKEIADLVRNKIEHNVSSARNILLHLLFPDKFERISSTSNKEQIVEAFRGLAGEHSDIDEALFNIRGELKKEYGIEDLDFYDDDIKRRWQKNINWWVEKTYVEGNKDRIEGDTALGTALWSPQRSQGNADIYRFMRDIKPGDIVLHFTDNYAFTGFSNATKKYEEFGGVTGTDWGEGPSYIVRLSGLVTLDPPLSRDVLFSSPYSERLVSLIDSGQGNLFFNREPSLRQGAYITPAPIELIRILDDAYRSIAGRTITETILGGSDTGLDIRGLEELKSSFLNHFPEFNTFQDPGEQFLKAEDKWKRLAADRMHSLFDNWIRNDVSSLSPDNVAVNIQTVLASPIEGIGVPNLTNWRDNEYIKNNLLNTDDKKDEVARLIHNLLQKAKSDESIESPLENLLSWLKEQKCAANISKIFPSILLFYWNPHRFIFIKPTLFDRFLTKIGGKPIGDGVHLTSSAYNQVLQKMNLVRDALRDLGPRDMIDIQSFYYVAIENLRPGTLSSENGTEDGTVEPNLPPLNLILYGPPGTGKTYKIRHDYMPMFRKKDLSTGEVCNNYEFVTFHQSFSYEDFVEGIKPCVVEGSGTNTITYEVKDGIFKQLVSRACSNPNNYYAIFIDEINRANISRVFGELITLIEEDKRLVWDPNETKWTGDMTVKLPYTHTQNPDQPLFGIPNNIYIIGTMNTADRSIALIDTALRRRFAFEEVIPDSKIISLGGNPTITKDNYTIDLVKLLDAINDRIEILYDRDHRIGHSYFLGLKTYEDLEKVFLNNIIPLLQEYFYADWEKIQIILADVTSDDDVDNRPKVKDTAIITYKITDPRTLPGAADWELQNKRVYNVSKSIHPTSIIKIYET